MKNYHFSYLLSALALCVMSLISCVQKPEEYLKSEVTVSGGVNYFENSMDFGFEGGDYVMSFNSNLKWSMEIANTQNGVQWLTIAPQTGNKGNNKVTFTAQENKTYEDRSVIVRFLAGDTVRNIRVNQKRLEAITLTSDIFEVPVEGGNIDIEVNHSTDYEVTIPEEYKSWIHKSTSNTRGLLESSKLTFTIDPSDEYEKREGRIYFTAKGEEEIVTVYQAGSGKLILSQDEYNLTGAEQEFTVDISSNFDFGMDLPEVDWLKENTSQTRGMSSHTLKFKVTENDDLNARSAKIKIYDKNNSKFSETIVINQSSIGAVITIDTLEYNVSSEKQDLDIEVRSNFNYNIDFQGANWVKQRKTNSRGITSRLLSLTVEKNTGYETRTAKIKLYDKNSSVSVEIIINQFAGTPMLYFKSSKVNVILGKEYSPAVTNHTDQSLVWTSSDNSVATVTISGIVKGVSKGKATINVESIDGKNKASCEVTVDKIEEFVIPSNGNSVVTIVNNVIQPGSRLDWKLRNESTEKIKLKSLQLVYGPDQKKSEVMEINKEVGSGVEVSYPTPIGDEGMSLPVTCKFFFEHDKIVHTVETVYKKE